MAPAVSLSKTGGTGPAAPSGATPKRSGGMAESTESVRSRASASARATSDAFTPAS